VLNRQNSSWTSAQKLSLYQGGVSGQILLRSTPDGSSVFMVDVTAQAVRVITWNDAQKAYQVNDQTIPTDVNALALTVLPDGSKAYILNSGSTANSFTVVDVSTLQATTVDVTQTYVTLTDLISAPDGRRLYATDTNAAALRILDPASLRILQTIPLNPDVSKVQSPTGLTILPDGSKIFTANTYGNSISIIQQVQM
jgi:DNA-binding beta-propeller fold protein YncE